MASSTPHEGEPGASAGEKALDESERPDPVAARRPAAPASGTVRRPGRPRPGRRTGGVRPREQQPGSKPRTQLEQGEARTASPVPTTSTAQGVDVALASRRAAPRGVVAMTTGISGSLSPGWSADRRSRSRRWSSGSLNRCPWPGASRGIRRRTADGRARRSSDGPWTATVPAPTTTASAIARSSPITNRSGSKKPLIGPPPPARHRPSSTTPSSVETKFATIVGRSARSGIESAPGYRARRAGGRGAVRASARLRVGLPQRFDRPARRCRLPVDPDFAGGPDRHAHRAPADPAHLKELAPQRRIAPRTPRDRPSSWSPSSLRARRASGCRDDPPPGRPRRRGRPSGARS